MLRLLSHAAEKRVRRTFIERHTDLGKPPSGPYLPPEDPSWQWAITLGWQQQRLPSLQSAVAATEDWNGSDLVGRQVEPSRQQQGLRSMVTRLIYGSELSVSKALAVRQGKTITKPLQQLV